MQTLTDLLSNVPSLSDISLSAGESVFRKGDRAAYVYVVKRGGVTLQRYSKTGKASVLYRAGPGDSFAESAIFSEHHHCHALVETPSIVIAYAKPIVLDYFQSNGQASFELARILSQQVQSLRHTVELHNILSAPERVYQYLLGQSDDRRSIILNKTFKALSQELGLTHETLYRSLARLEKDGVIWREGKAINLLERF